MSRGPKKSGFNPVKEYYRCPVKNCNSQFRGDEISRHFTKNANLDLLREALENQSNLRKNLPSGKVVAKSAEFCNFYDATGSVLDSKHYIHPCEGCIIAILDYFRDLTSHELLQ